MFPQEHHIGRLTIDIETVNVNSALQLRARAEGIAWKLLPKTLERVFDALAPIDMHVRIDRLALDLGEIAADALERDIPLALERVLTEALTQALASALYAPSAHARALSPSAALLNDFETYLVHGTIPFRDAGNTPDPAQIMQSLIGQQPAALVDMLRRHSGNRHVIERLVLQAGDAGLRALLGILALADAAIILAYLDDVQQLHVQMPSPPLPEPALRRALWVLTLEYLLYEAGTQFNRRAFLANLLEGLAQTEGIAYSALLRMLNILLAKTRAHRPLGGALPGVLDELLRGLDIDIPLPASATRPERIDAGVMELQPLHASTLATAMANPDTAALARWPAQATAPQNLALIRALANDLGLLHRVASAMDENALTAALSALSTAHAGQALDDLHLLWARHRIEPLIELDEAAFKALTWALALTLLLPMGKSGFDRTKLRNALLAGLARYDGLAPSHLGSWHHVMTSASSAQHGTTCI